MNQIDENTKIKFAESALQTYDYKKIKVNNVDEAIKTILEELNENLELNKSKIKQDRCNHFRVPKTSPEDYAEQIFFLESDKSILAGIRHTGGNINKPFVSVWPNFAIETPGHIESICDFAKKTFRIFSPKHIELWLNPNTDFARKVEDSVTPALRYIAGNTADLSNEALPENSEKIKFEFVKDDYRPWYESVYKRFHQAYPELKDWVPVNEDSEMKECLSQGLMYYVLVEEKKAGLIAANESDFLGLKGAYFTELLLDDNFKGKNLAPALQRKFTEQFLKNFEVVWGSIDAKNLPSTKTALRVGRQAIRSEYFFPL